MIETLDIIDHLDLNTPEKIINKCKNSSKLELSKICEALSKSIPLVPAIPNRLDLFDVVASGSLSGHHNWGCSSFSCRFEKLSNLASFSVLYSNKVLIPNFFATILHNLDKKDEKHFKEQLASDLMIIHKLRPVFEAGFIQMFSIGLCENCHTPHLRYFDDKFNDVYINSLEDDYIQKTTCKVESHPSRGNFFDITTSEDLFDHGKVRSNNEIAKDFSIGTTLNSEQLKETGVIRNLIKRSLSQLRFQFIMSNFAQANLLTDNRLHNDFINKDSEYEKYNKALNMLLLDTPFFNNVPLEKVIELREKDGESFEIYRNNLKKSLFNLANSKSLNPVLVKEFYNDSIKSEVFKLEQKIIKSKNILSKKLLFNISITGLCLGVGLKTGFMDPTTLKAFGAATTLGQIGTSLFERNQKQSDVLTNDFYFLWRVKQLPNQ